MKKKNRLIALIFIMVLSLNLIGCKDSSTETSDQNIEDITQIKSGELIKYKDSYIGDNSTVINIVSRLPANIYIQSFNLKTNEEPYEIAIYYKVNEEIEDENYLTFWNDKNSKDLLENNAIVLFSLIPNVDIIKFEIDNAEDDFYEYSRKELESKYNVDLVDISNNKDSLDDFFKNKE